MSNTGKPHSARMERSGIKIPAASKTGLKLLNSLAFDQLRGKHPDIRPELLPRPGFKDKTANDLTRSIIKFLQLKGHQCERISTTCRLIDQRKVVTDCIGHRRQIGSLKWIPTSGTRGSADISATIKGRSVKIEVKVGRDRQSLDQIKYAKSVMDAGGIYFIAGNFEQFFQWYSEKFE